MPDSPKNELHFVGMNQTTYMTDAWDVLQDVLRNYISGAHFAFNDKEMAETFKEKIHHDEFFAKKTEFTIEELLDTDLVADSIIDDAAYICMRHVLDGEWSLSRAILASHALSPIICNISEKWKGLVYTEEPKMTMFPSTKVPKDGELIS